MGNIKKYSTFRQENPRMVYDSYHYELTERGLELDFTFRIGDKIVFHPTALIERREFLDYNGKTELLDKLVFNIGMIELISYWKCLCPPIVEIACGSLTDEAKAFWLKTYWNGLGEFFYTNGIEETPETFMKIENSTATIHNPQILNSQLPTLNSYIVPIGGGKDSVVSLELLSAFGRPLPLIMNPRGATIGCVEAAGYTMSEVAVIRRTIDPKLLELNAQGCLNGHTPFSAMLAFYTLVISMGSGRINIALSNESSANESTVPGTSVNHQYSKSLEFENDFRRYVAAEISPVFNYFSFLRPLSELQIAMLFARFDKYHDVFRSCNAGSKQDIWCGNCAKCLFAYIILSPFIAPDRLNAIFGKAMLDDPGLQTYFDELTGIADVKPFECVGTISEVQSALSMTLTRWYPNERPYLLCNYKAMPPTTPLDTLYSEHNLSPEQLNLLQQCIDKNN